MKAGAIENEDFPCLRLLEVDPEVCLDYDGTLYTCQTCSHPNKQRQPKTEELKECKVCHQLYPASEIDKARRGWCFSCTSANMRSHKKSQKPESQESQKPKHSMIKTCVDCGEQFAPYKHGSTSPNICLSCMRKHSREGMRDKWLKKFRDEGMLIIDLNVLTDLLPKIEADATACLRTVEAQCLWYILERARKL